MCYYPSSNDAGTQSKEDVMCWWRSMTSKRMMIIDSSVSSHCGWGVWLMWLLC